jgi:hypothetical protein
VSFIAHDLIYSLSISRLNGQATSAPLPFHANLSSYHSGAALNLTNNQDLIWVFF